MTKHEAYNGIYDTHPSCEDHRVFFAFSDEQFNEGMKRCGYKDVSEITTAGMGLYGSHDALKSFLGEYESRAKRVAKECDPRNIYDYEYWNHECDYVGSDEEAIGIVVSIFGKETAKTVSRRHCRIAIDDIEE